MKDVWASYHLVLLPLGPSVPGKGRGKGNECKNNQGPQQPIYQGQLPVDGVLNWILTQSLPVKDVANSMD